MVPRYSHNRIQLVINTRYESVLTNPRVILPPIHTIRVPLLILVRKRAVAASRRGKRVGKAGLAREDAAVGLARWVDEAA